MSRLLLPIALFRWCDFLPLAEKAKMGDFFMAKSISKRDQYKCLSQNRLYAKIRRLL